MRFRCCSSRICLKRKFQGTRQVRRMPYIRATPAKSGGPGRTRTLNLGLRRSLLYPVELRSRCGRFHAKSKAMQGAMCPVWHRLTSGDLRHRCGGRPFLKNNARLSRDHRTSRFCAHVETPRRLGNSLSAALSYATCVLPQPTASS